MVVMTHRITEVVLDCADPQALARFYLALLGGRPRQSTPDWATIYADPVILAFQRVPEPKSVKNRCHIDVNCEDIPTATSRAESLGATRLGPVVHDATGSFQVMTDPAGNESCFVHGYPDPADG